MLFVPFNFSYNDGCEFVEPFPDALEHDKAERNADHRVGHAERLAAYRDGRRVPVT